MPAEMVTVSDPLAVLVDDAVNTHGRTVICRHGRRAAVLLSADDFDQMQERLAALSDPGMRSGDAVGDFRGLDRLSVAQLADTVRRAGLLD